MAKPGVMVQIGNFLFRHRNWLFPVFIVAVFALARPPALIDGSPRGEHVKDAIAIGLVAIGLAVRASVIGFAYIKRGGLKKKVYAANLVTEGMFGVVRNPLYVGNLLVYAGVFVMHGDPLVMTIGIVAFLFAYQCIVRAEEAYLRDKFGPGYDDYCADVPRWFPRLSRFKAATEGMRFNMQRVILNDYTTIANAVMMLALTEIYEQLSNPGVDHTVDVKDLGGIIGLAILVVALIAAYKKRADIGRWLGGKA